MRIPAFTAAAVLLALAACGGGDGDGEAEKAKQPPPGVESTPPNTTSRAKLEPRDEADSDFSAFRRDLLAALARRDTEYLYSVVSPTIRTSFGGGDGISSFKAMWKPESPDSLIWPLLTRILNMGGKLQGNVFTAPYPYAFWPDGEDAFSNVAITSERAAARAEPAANSPEVATLSYQIVKHETWQGLGENAVPTERSWARVELVDGRKAWLNGLDVWSPVGWRAMFEKKDGKWILNLLVAGD